MTTAAPMFHLGYRKSLDGLRGVSILLVLLLHGQHLAYLVIVVPVVLLSYYFIEKPCLKLKHRFSDV